MATTSLKDVSLGIRNIGSRTDFAGGEEVDLSAEEDRFSNIILSEGFISPTDAFEVTEGNPATMALTIGNGTAKSQYYLVEGTSVGMGNYIVRMEAADEGVTLAAADVSNPRIDEVYIVVQDDVYDSTGRALAVLAVRGGDPAGSPAAPGPADAWKAYALIASIAIPASAPNIAACTITDERIRSTVMVPAVDADLLGGNAPSFYAAATHNHNATYAPLAHVGAGAAAHANATDAAAGFMTAAQFTKLAGIAAGAQVNPSAADMLTAIKTVDGSGSGLDADTVDGQQASAFAASGHNHDTRYYTESEVNSLLNAKLTLSTSGVLTGYQSNKYSKQVRNITVSDVDAVLANMADGDVYMKYA